MNKNTVSWSSASHQGVTGPVYFVLWSLGFLSSMASFLEMHKLPESTSASAFAGHVVLLLAVVMISLMTFAYHDIYRLEHTPSSWYTVSAWVDLPIEKFIRVLIIVALLLGVGEAGQSLRFVADYIQVPSAQEWLKDFVRAPEERDISHSLFVKGSIGAFAFLAAWNVGALLLLRRLSISATVVLRLVSFGMLSLLSAAFWVLYYYKSPFLSDASLMIVVVFWVLLCVFLWSRWWWSIVTYGKSSAALFRRRAPPVSREFSNPELSRWRERLEEIYDKMRAMSQYLVICNDLRLVVLPNVYGPRFFTDSQWFARTVPKLVGRRSLLEIGTGTGIIALRCALNGAKVVATDINPSAVLNAQLNAQIHGVTIDVRQGDVYHALQPTERFDFVFWAHPFNNWDEPVSDMLLRSGRDYKYEGVEAYIAGAADHLAEGGRLLLGTGDSADLATIYRIAGKHGYTLRTVKEVNMPLAEWGDERITYMIIEMLRGAAPV